MSDDEQEKTANPVVTGLVALLAVSLAVGLILGGVALAGTRMLGLGDDSTTSADSTAKESAVIPRPSKTAGNGPQVTLQTEATEVTDEVETDDIDPTESETTEERSAITLQVDQTAVGNFERIDISGIYPGGEGAILQVQRFEGGQWADFNATIPVSGETFRTYVQSAQTGVNKFRVVDTAKDEVSNTVTVRVG